VIAASLYFTSTVLSLIGAEKIPEPGLHTLPLALGPRGVPGDSGESSNQPIITNQ
jgi:hypothetical protein